MHHYHHHLVAFSFFAGACALSPKGIGDEPGDTDAGSSASGQLSATQASSEGSGDSGDPTSGSADTGGDPACDDPRMMCTASIDCDAYRCGELDSVFDEEGCLRSSCNSHEQCATDERCYVPALWGGCTSSGIGCSDEENGMCQCWTTDDCGNGGYCVPQDVWSEVPSLTECSGSEPNDDYWLESMDFSSASPDVLLLYVQTGGGCEPHDWTTCWDASFLESNPVQIRLTVGHDAHGDSCEAIVSAVVPVDLTALKEAYESAYQTDTGTIIIGVTGQAGTIQYTF